MIRNFWYRLLNIGLQNRNIPFNEAKKIRLINKISIIGFIIIITIYLHSILTKPSGIPFYLVPTYELSIALIIVLVLHYKGCFNSARYLFFLAATISFILQPIAFGDIGSEHYHIAIFIFATLIFDKQWQWFSMFIISFLSFGVSKWIYYSYDNFPLEHMTKGNYPVNVSIALILILIAIYFFKQEYLDYRKEIDAKNEEISRQNEELKHTQAQLLQSDKMASLGVLSAGIAHEINNPLNYIRGANRGLAKYVLREYGIDDPQLLKCIKLADEGINRASSIVKSLGHYSRTHTDMTENCNIHEIIENVLVILQNRLKHKVKIIRDYNFNIPTQKGNEGRLHQAFLNLLSNAEQAIIEKGEIVISTNITDDLVEIIIKDTGKGISTENLFKISEPFFTTKEPGKGTGLGLSITYKIIEEHKGKIQVNSEIDKGTEFKIHLPVN